VETETAAFAEKTAALDPEGRGRVLKAAALAGGPGAAAVLLDLGMDADTIVAALVLEGFRGRALPESLPGEGAALALARGAERLARLKTAAGTKGEAENIRHMAFALAGDVREILIRLAEKLCAMRAMDAQDSAGAEDSAGAGGEEARKAAARECLDIYAPLADRLGVSWIKDEMEDLSLKFASRETYRQIKSLVAQTRAERGRFLRLAGEAISRGAKAAGLEIEVESRAKHFYSVYMKMRKRGKPAGEIRDLSGMRVVCDTVESCYALLGIAHRLWTPLDGTFKDYIARPKPNGYRSLHTSVTAGEGAEGSEGGGEGRLLEIQIRTREMHRVAEYGVASHWLYKQGASRDSAQAQEIGLVNRMKGWKREGAGEEASGLWLDGIKRELFKNWVYVFTPQGKVIRLPAGATPIDFAYHVHTAVGERCIGAKAGGQIIPLSSQLKNAQIVEIMTSASARPSANWLQLAKSPRTRSKIRSWLDKNDESFMAEKKKQAAEALAASPAPLPCDEPARAEPEVAPVLQMVLQPLSSVMRVRVEDEKNLMIRFARCCNPVTGDPIVGYVSRGRGVIIHRKNCASIAHNPEFEKRQIEAGWESMGSALVKRFRIEAKLAPNLFSEIEGSIRKWQGHLLEGRLEETAGNRLSGIFTMQLAKAGDLKAVMKNIRGIPGILSIQPIG